MSLDGLLDKNPNAYIRNFLEVYNTFKFNWDSDVAIRLCLFPFTLKGRDKEWITSLPWALIMRWN